MKEKTKLLSKATAKKIPEIVLTIVVVLGNSKFIPIVNSNVIAVNKKHPKLSSDLFSPL